MTTGPGRTRGEEPITSAGATGRTLARLCTPVATAGKRHGLEGLCVSRSLEQRLAGVLYASDAVSRQLDEIQQVIGEGPGATALAQRSPVLVPSLGDAVTARRWEVFGQEAERMGVASLFCFPVQVGAVGLGLMTLHGPRPVHLEGDSLTAFIQLSDALATAFIVPDGQQEEQEPSEDLLDSGSLITQQAVGMVSVQLECSLAEALVALRSRAYADGLTVAAVARDVVARRTRLSSDVTARPPRGDDGEGTERGSTDG